MVVGGIDVPYSSQNFFHSDMIEAVELLTSHSPNHDLCVLLGKTNNRQIYDRTVKPLQRMTASARVGEEKSILFDPSQHSAEDQTRFSFLSEEVNVRMPIFAFSDAFGLIESLGLASIVQPKLLDSGAAEIVPLVFYSDGPRPVAVALYLLDKLPAGREVVFREPPEDFQHAKAILFMQEDCWDKVGNRNVSFDLAVCVGDGEHCPAARHVGNSLGQEISLVYVTKPSHASYSSLSRHLCLSIVCSDQRIDVHEIPNPTARKVFLGKIDLSFESPSPQTSLESLLREAVLERASPNKHKLPAVRITATVPHRQSVDLAAVREGLANFIINPNDCVVLKANAAFAGKSAAELQMSRIESIVESADRRCSERWKAGTPTSSTRSLVLWTCST